MSSKLAGGDDAPAVCEPRVDYLGLYKHFVNEAETLSAALKAAHPKGTRLAGNFFSALISSSRAPARTVDPQAWLELKESGVITLKQYLAGVTVSVSVAEKELSAKDLAKVVKKSHSKAGKSLTSLKHLEGAEAAVLAVIAHIDSVMKDAVEGQAVASAHVPVLRPLRCSSGSDGMLSKEKMRAAMHGAKRKRRERRERELAKKVCSGLKVLSVVNRMIDRAHRRRIEK